MVLMFHIWRQYFFNVKGQFDHVPERRIPTRSSSASRLPIQGIVHFH